MKGIVLPSLWVAFAGDRPVADEHDDPGHTTWGWKDDSLDKGYWYYSKLLRKRATFVSLEVIPYFYALSPNFGDPEQDYLIEYQEGKLTQECKLIYEALLNEGPLDTITLRKKARLSNNLNEGRFNKALEDLQTSLRVIPAGICDAGAWHYSYIYDCTHRRFPNLIDQAGQITEGAARDKLTTLYLASVGAITLKEIERVFRWRAIDSQRSSQRLVDAGIIHKGTCQDKPGEEWLTHTDFIHSGNV
ncbi:MAG TPA: hypothetical protein VN376_04825 [Longilinea sp.]|nr:hypothetical protein [Longilinea sp.]